VSPAGLPTVKPNSIPALLRLLLISDQDGEVLAARAALKRVLASIGLDPHHIVDCYERGAQPDTPSVSPDTQGDDRSLIWFAWHRRDRLTPRDRQFIERLTEWRGPLSTKQRKWLGDILDKLSEAAA
jgi:DNA-binding transcriptional LysR family regulator